MKSANNQLEVLRTQLAELQDAVQTLEESRDRSAKLIELEESGGDIGDEWRPKIEDGWK